MAFNRRETLLSLKQAVEQGCRCITSRHIARFSNQLTAQVAIHTTKVATLVPLTQANCNPNPGFGRFYKMVLYLT